MRVGDLSKSGQWFRNEFPGVAEVVPVPLLLGLPFALEVALALLARRVKPRCPPLVALRALRGRRRLVGLSPTPPGIVRLRGSAALLVASSSMICTSIQGSSIDVVAEGLRVRETSQQRAVREMLAPSG